jgi:hypothetical protein
MKRNENVKSLGRRYNCRPNAFLRIRYAVNAIPKGDAMTQPNPGDKISLTVHLSPDVAKRLKAAAETQKRAAADLVADLLDRHLPRPQTGGQAKSSIPYS